MNRILIYGPPRAGKHTMQRALIHREHPDDIRSSYVEIPLDASNGQRALHYLRVATVRTPIGGIAFCTFNGEVFDVEVWRPLLRDAEGIILVLNSDPQLASQTGNRVMVEMLAEVLSDSKKFGCIACTKADLNDGASAVQQTIERARQIQICRDWPVLQTRTDQPESICGPIDYMIGLFNADVRR
jgi:hypothetical protein